MAIGFCDPGGIQTPDFQNRNLTFCSAELRGQKHIRIYDFFPYAKIQNYRDILRRYNK